MDESAGIMVEEFSDEGDPGRYHDAFRRWQKQNGRGHVLNFNVSPPKFHKSGCRHIADFSDPEVSLTKHRKVCAKSRGDLVKWAKDNSVDYVNCKSCM